MSAFDTLQVDFMMSTLPLDRRSYIEVIVALFFYLASTWPICIRFQATGQGQPATPKSQIIIPKPPLTIQTARGKYYFKLIWDPPTIPVGKPTNFGILFEDNSQTIQSGVATVLR